MTPEILDSGERRNFETGATRDMAAGKGRCDLMPLDEAARYICTYCDGFIGSSYSSILIEIGGFMRESDASYLYSAIDHFRQAVHWDVPTMFLELSKHFESGLQKYGERNWEKGIPIHSFIDSAIRHMFKTMRGDTDEPHAAAFVWNLFCAIWTLNHHPNCNDLPPVNGSDDRVIINP